jgi:hypothetical protein
MAAAHLADQFHAALLAGDAAALRSILADDVTFSGPLAEATGAEECIGGLTEMAKMTTSDEVAVRLADDNNVLIWSTMTTKVAPAIETATWLQIKADKIATIRTVYDARGAAPPQR